MIETESFQVAIQCNGPWPMFWSPCHNSWGQKDRWQLVGRTLQVQALCLILFYRLIPSGLKRITFFYISLTTAFGIVAVYIVLYLPAPTFNWSYVVLWFLTIQPQHAVFVMAEIEIFPMSSRVFQKLSASWLAFWRRTHPASLRESCMRTMRTIYSCQS